MSDLLCDLCHARPATVRAEVVSDGRRETMNLCEVDYRRLARQGAVAGLVGNLGDVVSSLFNEP